MSTSRFEIENPMVRITPACMVNIYQIITRCKLNTVDGIGSILLLLSFYGAWKEITGRLRDGHRKRWL